MPWQEMPLRAVRPQWEHKMGSWSPRAGLVGMAGADPATGAGADGASLRKPGVDAGIKDDK